MQASVNGLAVSGIWPLNGDNFSDELNASKTATLVQPVVRDEYYGAIQPAVRNEHYAAIQPAVHKSTSHDNTKLTTAKENTHRYTHTHTHTYI